MADGTNDENLETVNDGGTEETSSTTENTDNEIVVDPEDIIPVSNLLDAAANEDAAQFQDVLNAELRRRINDAIDFRKIEIAADFGSEIPENVGGDEENETQEGDQ